MDERLDKHGARLYTLEQLDIPQQVSIARMWESDSYKSHEDHMQLFEALEKSMNRDHSEELAQDLAEARKKKKKSRESQKTPPGSPSHQPPPPPPPAGPSGASGAPRASGSAQMPPSPPPPSSTNQEKERPNTPEPAWLIRSSDVPVLTNNWALALASNYSPPSEDSLLAQTGDIAIFINWFCKIRGITELKPQDMEGPVYEIVKVFHPDQTTNTGGPPGQVIIQSDFFFNKDLEYLRYDSKGRRPALSVSKMKAAYYPDAGLEQMVPDQFWIKEECKYDIAAMYGISHWWFQRQRFYIDRHTSEGDRSAVRTHMGILSVLRIEVFSMYGYDYMKKIVLSRADLNVSF
uniref:Uncharacterized protein n=1 Tax=Tanacetum cinerariifolium TaxID=118510 RepID=A0A699L8B6_TANCI|nr:hypothetical protein [Tanacetum cinerariifolium]